MRAPSAALLLLIALTGCKTKSFWSVERTSGDTLRTVRQGQLVGGEGRYRSHAWLGIPFAKPPTGERRWKKSEPPDAWSGVHQATSFGNVCPQFGSMFVGGSSDEVVGDEDCLTLSVWAPPFKPTEVPTGDERLPVMLWIHGGGSSIGTAASYEGGRLAAEQKVVVVAVQYRLGPFGWFRHPALRDGADELDASGNFGTLDLVRALEWVRDNATAFGGDPGNVTIFGESAGGQHVYTLLLAPQAKGLFHRAIVESGGLWSTAVERAEGFVSDSPEVHKNSSGELLARILVKEGRAKDPADARHRLQTQGPGELAKWMRELPVERLFKAYIGEPRGGLLDAPAVFRDGVVLPKEAGLDRLSAPDGWNRVPVLAGTNRDETRLFLFLEPGRVRRVLGVFPRLEDEKSYLASSDTTSRLWRLNGVVLPLEAMVRGGATNVYAYRWDWHDEPTVAGGDLSVMLGAAHGLELPFVFGHFDLGMLNFVFDERNAAEREAVSSAMRQYWAEFARAGNPGRGTSGTLPEWNSWSGAGAGETQLVIDTSKNGGVRMTAAAESAKTIFDDLFADQRLDAKGRCRVLHGLVTGWAHEVALPDFTRAEYDAQPACRGFSFDAYPWK